jgi:hypothetical protein
MATFSLHPNGDATGRPGRHGLPPPMQVSMFSSVDDIISEHCCPAYSRPPLLQPNEMVAIAAMCALLAIVWVTSAAQTRAIKRCRLRPLLVPMVVRAELVLLLLSIALVASPIRHRVLGDPRCRPNSGARLVDEFGQRMLRLSDIGPGVKLFCVWQGTHFVWPTHFVGHKVTPRNVESPVAGKPIVLTQLSDGPRVYAVENFVSQKEIDELIQYNSARVQPSTVGFAGHVDLTRTSSTAWDHDTHAARELLSRTFKILAMDEDSRMADELQILRYTATGAGPLRGKGEWYKPHLDYFQASDGFKGHVPTENNGTNRFATMFLYLSDVSEGGATVFPLSTSHDGYNGEKLVHDGTVKTPGYIDTSEAIKCCTTQSSALKSFPKRGNAVLFYSQQPNGTLDPYALHGGCPPLNGTKWAANVWIWCACCVRVRTDAGQEPQPAAVRGGGGHGCRRHGPGLGRLVFLALHVMSFVCLLFAGLFAREGCGSVCGCARLSCMTP